MEAAGFAGAPAEVAGPSETVLASLPGAGDAEGAVLGGKGRWRGSRKVEQPDLSAPCGGWSRRPVNR